MAELPTTVPIPPLHKSPPADVEKRAQKSGRTRKVAQVGEALALVGQSNADGRDARRLLHLAGTASVHATAR
jgi:hypothetical protein